MTKSTVTLIAVGTYGDVQPYIALGKGLQSAGLNVRVLTTPDFRSLATQYGLEFHQIFDMNVEAIMQSDDAKVILETKNPVTMLRRLIEFCRPWFHEALDNSMTHHISIQMIWQLFRSIVNDTRINRSELEKIPLAGSWHTIKKLRLPVMMGYSPKVLPPSANWHENIHVTGYWFLDEPEEWSPPPDLAEFLANGKPPVYIGFGSMAN